MPYLKHCLKCKLEDHCCIYDEGEGFVFIGIRDARKIKRKKKIDYKDFIDHSELDKETLQDCKDDELGSEGKLRYNQIKDKRILRLKTKENGECVFLKDGQCSIYKIRPNICRTYPFWVENNKVILHDEDSDCTLSNKDIIKIISKKEKNRLKKTHKKIKKEDKYYRKNIKKFVKKHKLL